jgi:hypothetical protein
MKNKKIDLKDFFKLNDELPIISLLKIKEEILKHHPNLENIFIHNIEIFEGNL